MKSARVFPSVVESPPFFLRKIWPTSYHAMQNMMWKRPKKKTGCGFLFERIFILISSFLLNLIFSLGTMHIVATNIILWIRTLIKESLHEITESEEEAHRVAQAVSQVVKSTTTTTTNMPVSLLCRQPKRD